MTDAASSDIPKVAILGGGQLALMMDQEAERVPASCTIVCAPGDESCRDRPNAIVVEAFVTDRIRTAAQGCDVLTFDHEVISNDVLVALDQAIRIAPSPAQMLFSHKDAQRQAFRAALLPVPNHAVVASMGELNDWLDSNPSPWLLKAAFGGYDGRGVLITTDRGEARAFVDGNGVVVAEELLDLTAEAAVLVARNANGDLRTWPVFDTIQTDGMCASVTYPSKLPERVQQRMTKLAIDVAEFVQSQGVLAIEFFVVGERVLINELAPRPHNSGHLTIEGSDTSQFVNHLRGVVGMPLGDTAMRYPAVVMVNLVGRESANEPQQDCVEHLDGAAVHLYGKTSRPKRKLGHITAWGDDLADVERRAHTIAADYQAVASAARKPT